MDRATGHGLCWHGLSHLHRKPSYSGGEVQNSSQFKTPVGPAPTPDLAARRLVAHDHTRLLQLHLHTATGGSINLADLQSLNPSTLNRSLVQQRAMTSCLANMSIGGIWYI